MTSRCLLIEVGFLDGRYHGRVDWPPSPFRLFQALVAGAYGGRWAAEPEAQRRRKDAAFRWLEEQDPPTIATPHARTARGVEVYVPNNDLDSVGGDPANVAKIRGSTKVFAPRLFDPEVPLLYAWPFEGDDEPARLLCELVERMHTLGYGIDAAYARAKTTSGPEAEARLRAHGGPIARPASSAVGRISLQCPARGSLESLHARYRSGASRFERHAENPSRGTTFRKAPSVRSRDVGYEQPATLLLFDLRRSDSAFHVLAPERALELALAVRDRAVQRLRSAWPDRAPEIERLVKGRRDSSDADKPQRLRFYALPSIGHAHADMGLRRVVVEVPPQCPLRADDIAWALSGEQLSADRETGEVLNDLPTLVHAEERSMLEHYVGAETGARRWRTVTPMALPVVPRAGRQGSARIEREQKTAAAIRQALRHAGIASDDVAVRLHREPFHGNGARAEAFAFNRFASCHLMHVDLTFSSPRTGPLLLGDGRFLGLGLFAPEREPVSIHAFRVMSTPVAPVETTTRALRRAVMARVRDALGLRDSEGLPVFFSGHDDNGVPSRGSGHAHLYFVRDPFPAPRLIVIAPHIVDRRSASNHELQHLSVLDGALAGFSELRAGSAWSLKLTALPEPEDGDSLLGPSLAWESVTDYRPTRHPKSRDDARTWLINDVRLECERHGLPRPSVAVPSIVEGPRGGLFARVCLTFSVAVAGPILIGRDAHFGGGLFRALDTSTQRSDASCHDMARERREVAGAAARTEDTHPTAASTAAGRAEHGVRTRAGELEQAGGTTQPPESATRRIDTTLGRLTYAEVAPHLAERALRLADSIARGEFAPVQIDEGFVRALHQRLCGDLVPEFAGHWRDRDVRVGGHEPPPSHAVPIAMREYALDLNERIKHVDESADRLLETLAFAEHRLLWVHPFLDFNGRVTRLLLSELLRRLDLPAVDLAPEDGEPRRRYFEALRAADARDLSPLMVIWQERLARG